MVKLMTYQDDNNGLFQQESMEQLDQPSVALINEIQDIQENNLAGCQARAQKQFQMEDIVQAVEQISNVSKKYSDYIQHLADYFRLDIEAIAEIQVHHREVMDENIAAEKEAYRELHKQYTELKQAYDSQQSNMKALETENVALTNENKKLQIHNKKLLLMTEKYKTLRKELESRLNRSNKQASRYDKLRKLEEHKRRLAEKNSKKAVASAKDALKCLFDYDGPLAQLNGKY